MWKVVSDTGPLHQGAGAGFEKVIKCTTLFHFSQVEIFQYIYYNEIIKYPLVDYCEEKGVSMALIKCKMCGGDMRIVVGSTVA